MLEKLGPLDADRIADLGPYLESVPDPRSRRGRWYSLTAILLMCACAAVCGAKSIDELAEFGERATNSLLASLGVRRHLLGWRRSPKPVTRGRVLQALDGDALDQAVGAYLADRHRITASADMPETRSRQIIAVDGKALKGSARLAAPRRHLLSAVTHDRVATIAQVEVGAKTNEVRHFKPLLAPLDLADTVVTFDALHSVKANISPARSKPALSPTTSAASLSPTPTSPSGSTAAASPPAGPKPARTSTRSPASPPIKPAPSTSPPCRRTVFSPQPRTGERPQLSGHFRLSLDGLEAVLEPVAWTVDRDHFAVVQ
ncbi:ISAs1 family transposase [Streptomyces sp. B21-105]|uniref:ISAs1 family transposase n=1 Tax=Streptomyces sp. B21-105 TaxID=3039417 RepID=UPI002FEFF04A